MKSAIDTNVISALWASQPAAGQAQALLSLGLSQDVLVICGAVYAELLASPGVSREFVEMFLLQTGIELDLRFEKPRWEDAGLRFAEYAIRRRKSGGEMPRRILADFLIGAHALRHADRLLTFNEVDYLPSFPELVVASPTP